MEISKKVLPESTVFSMVSTIVVVLKSLDSLPCKETVLYIARLGVIKKKMGQIFALITYVQNFL